MLDIILSIILYSVFGFIGIYGLNKISFSKTLSEKTERNIFNNLLYCIWFFYWSKRPIKFRHSISNRLWIWKLFCSCFGSCNIKLFCQQKQIFNE